MTLAPAAKLPVPVTLPPASGEVAEVRARFGVEDYLDVYDGRFLPGSRVGAHETWGGVPARLITHEEMEHLKEGIHGVVNARVK